LRWSWILMPYIGLIKTVGNVLVSSGMCEFY
jgi:hypothetical protein